MLTDFHCLENALAKPENTPEKERKTCRCHRTERIVTHEHHFYRYIQSTANGTIVFFYLVLCWCFLCVDGAVTVCADPIVITMADEWFYSAEPKYLQKLCHIEKIDRFRSQNFYSSYKCKRECMRVLSSNNTQIKVYMDDATTKYNVNIKMVCQNSWHPLRLFFLFTQTLTLSHSSFSIPFELLMHCYAASTRILWIGFPPLLRACWMRIYCLWISRIACVCVFWEAEFNVWRPAFCDGIPSEFTMRLEAIVLMMMMMIYGNGGGGLHTSNQSN